MKREIKIEIKDDLNHYALIKQKNNRENETDYGMLIDKDQYEQLRQHFVSGSLAFLGKILEEEMSAEMRTWLMELNVKLANDR